MINLAKMRTWAETRLGTVSGLIVNTDKKLSFEDQITKEGAPIATVIVAEGNGDIEGNVFRHRPKIEIWLLERDDGDYEKLVRDTVAAFEGNAYPDFYESGDPSHAPATLKSYDWRIWGMFQDEQSGIIVIRLILTIFYKNISNR